jgi:hypothetical protein
LGSAILWLAGNAFQIIVENARASLPLTAVSFAFAGTSFYELFPPADTCGYIALAAWTGSFTR